MKQENISNNQQVDALEEKLVQVNRVAKVVKGGRIFGFTALTVVGDGNGRVGFGRGKAKEVPEAVRKATENAKTKMIRVHLKENRTIHHDTVGRFGAGKVILRTAAPGCLLYTSPSPRDLVLSRMPSSA